MKKVLQIALVCVLFLVAKDTSALTVSKTVRWHGGWCSLCGFTTYDQEYCCAWNPWYNYYAGDTNDTSWSCTTCRGYFGGNKYFLDPLPSGATVTGIQVTVCEADCGDSYVAVFINGVSVGTYYPNGNCYCGGSSTFSITAGNVNTIMAAYHLGGMDTVTVNPNSTMCFSTAQIIFTYVLGANLNTFPAQSIHNIPYCPGDNVDVPYYAAGAWNAGNTFTAQLSDSSGSFSSPVSIGTVTSTVSGTIHATIPSNTLITSSHYRIRVKGSNPVTIGTDTVSNITISNASPSITASGPLMVCSGHSLTLTSSTGSSYIWYQNPNNTGWSSFATSHSVTINPTVQTVYKVFVANASGCSGTSTNDTVQIAPLPDNPTVIHGPTSICFYGQSYYSTPTCNNASSYYWTINPSYLQGNPYGGGGGGDTIEGQGSQNVLVKFGNISFAALKVWAVDSCGSSSGFAELDIIPIQGYGDGTWLGGKNDNWFDVANWCGGVPTNYYPSDIIIDGNMGINNGYNMYMPVINQDSSIAGAVCHNLWLYGDYDTLTVANDLNGIGSLSIYGNFINGGVLGPFSAFYPNNRTVIFAGYGDDAGYDYTTQAAGNGMTYSGGGNHIGGCNNTPFYNLTVNKGTDANTVLDNLLGAGYGNENIITMMPGGNLSLINGTLLLSQDSSVVRTTANPFIIPSTACLDLNGGWLLSGNYSITNQGKFVMDYFATADTIGTASGNTITNDGTSATMELYNGILKCASQVIVQNGATLSMDDINPVNTTSPIPPKLIINTVGTNSNTKALLDVDGASNIYHWATNNAITPDDTIVFEKANQGTLAGGGNDLKIVSGTGTKSLLSEFKFGDAYTPTGTIFHVRETMTGVAAPYDVNINTYNKPTLRLDSTMTIQNKLKLNGGVVDLNHNILHMSYNYPSAIANTSNPYGYILSEDSVFGAAVAMPVLSGQQYTIPFGNKYGFYIPFKFTPGTNDNLQVATYAPSDSLRHRPLPPTVTHIRADSAAGAVDSANMVNRYWKVDANNVSTSNVANIQFSYAYNENPSAGQNVRAQRWISANTGWMSPYQVYSAGAGAGQTATSSTNTSSSPGTVAVGRLNHCSVWALARFQHPLPIDLLDFTATYTGKGVDLRWSTAMEENNEFFTISKSLDEQEWGTLTEVLGAGNSNEPRDYSAFDGNPYTGTSYYKLSQTDYNGNTTQAGIAPVYIGASDFSLINTFSDASKGTINVLINDNSAEVVTVTIYDLLGNQMKNVQYNTVKGVNNIQINADQLAKGIYFVAVSNSTQRLTGKIAK